MDVIVSAKKVYELSSWNEQGEITKVEGMLTIAFSFISSCSHRDNYKQLYLIVKIPYLVDMFSYTNKEGNTINNIIAKKELTEDEEIELVRGILIKGFSGIEWKSVQPHLIEIFHKYINNIDKIKKLETKIDKLESENNEIKDKIEELIKKMGEFEKIKKENHRLKIISGETKSGWKLERNLIYRNNPITGEIEQYPVPFIFDYFKVSTPNFYSRNDGVKCIEFYHDDDKYDLPYDAYLWLKGELLEQKKIKTKKSKIEKLAFKEKDDVIVYFENYFIDSDRNLSKLVYLEKAVDFLWDLKDKKEKDKKFGTSDFRKRLGFCSPATVDNYLDMFVECNLLIKLGIGAFRVNIE